MKHEEINLMIEQAKVEIQRRQAAGWTKKDFALAMISIMETGKDLPILPLPSSLNARVSHS